MVHYIATYYKNHSASHSFHVSAYTQYLYSDLLVIATNICVLNFFMIYDTAITQRSIGTHD